MNNKINNSADDKKSSSSSTKLAGSTNSPAVATKAATELKDMSDKKAMSNSNSSSNKSIQASLATYTRGAQSTNTEKATDSDSSPMNPNVVSVSSTGENSSSLTAPKSHSGYVGSNSHRGSRRPIGQATDFQSNSDGHPRTSVENLSRTNLYIRGLTPNTTDEDLYNMCAKFGNIVSTKAIQDKASGSCRGEL